MTEDMLIVSNLEGHYDDSLERYYDFETLSTDSKDHVFFYGHGSLVEVYHNKELADKFKNFKSRIYYNGEHPCAWTGNDINYMKASADMKKYFNKIFTVCPYTAEWLNKLQKTDKFSLTFVPVDKKYIIDDKVEKEHDVIYWGGVHGEDHKSLLDTISKFKYNFFTLGPQEWGKGQEPHYYKYITHLNSPRPEMWEVLKKTKINVCMNIIHLKEEQKRNIKSIARWEENEAFSHIDEGIIPQMKTRSVESAISRTLMLVKRDPWNVVENWYEPDKEFLYYDNNEELEDKIKDVLNNWPEYQHIVENAFNKVVNNYTCEDLVAQMAGGKSV
tara:strand:+ start:9664 stop:10653 length:990 start_codon:yes stop_codon:yes gene_type:complete